MTKKEVRDNSSRGDGAYLMCDTDVSESSICRVSHKTDKQTEAGLVA